MPMSLRMGWAVGVVVGLVIAIADGYKNCVNETALMGCSACATNISLALNASENKFTCIAVPDCSLVLGDLCTACNAPYIMDTLTNNCELSQGCMDYANSSCLACTPVGYVLLEGRCYFKSIAYCASYNVANGSLVCQTCIFADMDPTALCELNSTNTSICAAFNYGIGVCEQCPNGTILHSNRLRCYVAVAQCAAYDMYGYCILCNTNYVQIKGNCNQVTSAAGVSYQVPIAISTGNVTAARQYQVLSICLDINSVYNATRGVCQSIPSSPFPHCMVSNASTCTGCMRNYYLTAASTCRLCQIAIANCALCLNETVCQACKPNYYELSLPDLSTKCMPCSIYGCALCTTNIDSSLSCLSCSLNFTLYMGSCLSCPSSFAYSIASSKCINCTIAFCRFCSFTASLDQPVTCIECQQNYYLYAPNNCTALNASSVSIKLGDSFAKEVLKKAAPGIEAEYYNDGVGLMGACTSSNGFACACSNVSLTSVCTNFTFQPVLTALKFNSIKQIAQYPDILRMAAEFPSYNLSTQLSFSIDANSMLTQYQFWNLLSAYTYSLAREQAAAATLTATSQSYLRSIISMLAPMQKVFSEQKVSILQGNGFYFKYIPPSLSTKTGDDNYISSTISSNYYTAFYSYFTKVNQPSLLTGVIHVFTNSSDNFNLTVRKSGYFDSTGNLSLQINGKNQNNSVVLREGYFTVTGLSPSLPNLSKGIQIIGASGAATEDPYQNQRIQNIFYSQSWLYILFFIFLYLLFIPLCALVDCCEPQHTLRKKVGQEEPSAQKQSQDVTVLKVNYRDFFPIYNVGNTPRPQRLRKVCLFIVNMQHIVTFLTLVYFNFPGGQPVAAIALVVPAYLCTIIMGYICGTVFRLLPGNMKYIVNVFSLGYWVLWIFLMRLMGTKSSSDYRLFILVFSILSFFLDMVIDLLETLLVYFSIRQGQAQVSLFNCLARWLSWRGYYEFDMLAKQMGAQV